MNRIHAVEPTSAASMPYERSHLQAEVGRISAAAHELLGGAVQGAGRRRLCVGCHCKLLEPSVPCAHEALSCTGEHSCTAFGCA